MVVQMGSTKREEGHQDGRHHTTKDVDGIQTTRQEEQRQDDEELNHITTQHHKDVFTDRVGYNTRRHLCRELCCEGQYAKGQGPDESANQQK